MTALTAAVVAIVAVVVTTWLNRRWTRSEIEHAAEALRKELAAATDSLQHHWSSELGEALNRQHEATIDDVAAFSQNLQSRVMTDAAARIANTLSEQRKDSTTAVPAASEKRPLRLRLPWTRSRTQTCPQCGGRAIPVALKVRNTSGWGS